MKDEIFAIWISKENTYMMPFLYEVCIASWQVLNPSMNVTLYVSNPDIKFNFLSRDTTNVVPIEDAFPGLISKASEIIGDDVPEGMRFAHRSDYIRYSILANSKNRIYVDADLVCLKSIENLVNDNRENNIGIIMAYEDTMRICNAFLASLTEDAQMFYENIRDNYNTRYVKTSYTFNSTKYPMILKNQFSDVMRILPFKGGFFYPNWEHNENGDITLYKASECPLKGYGTHLYNADINWKQFKNDLSNYLYTDKVEWWIVKHLNNVMDAYMNSMVSSPLRDIMSDTNLVDNLKDLYGDKYLNQFKGGYISNE